jgi:allophanate hydrolase subunit 2
MAAAGAVLTLTLVPTGAAAAAPARAEAPVTAVAADEPDPLPNFFGRNLFHVYSTVSAETALQRHDLSGENRKVLWPPNWKVCTQSPKAGTKLHGGTLKLGVVKTDEKCPQR